MPETLGLLKLGTLATGPDNNVQYIMPSLCCFPKFFITSEYSMYHLGSKKEMLEATIHYLKSFLPRVVKIPMKKMVTTLKKKKNIVAYVLYFLTSGIVIFIRLSFRVKLCRGMNRSMQKLVFF